MADKEEEVVSVGPPTQSKKNKRKERREKHKQKERERHATAHENADLSSVRAPALYGEVTNIGWEALDPPISDTSLLTLKKMGFFKTTPVQQATIPLFLTHKDVAVEACTGSGKTLAFLIPIFEILHRREQPLRKKDVGAIILTPTRELAMQIHAVASPFLEAFENKFSLLLLIGGASVEEDLEKYNKEGGSIVIATPGRMEDIMSRLGGEFKVSSLEVLVMDEADKLLAMGFRPSINSILDRLPKQRRTGLFSATQTEEVEHLARAGLRNPRRISVRVHAAEGSKHQKIPRTLTNWYMMCNFDEKLSQLLHFIGKRQDQKFIVYFLTCACVDFFWRVFQTLKKDKATLKALNLESLPDLKVLSLHGKVPHPKRIEIFNQFQDLKGNVVLFATDLASRGLDVPDVDWVIQFDPPQDPNVFVHRIGRCARMGRQGNALVFLSEVENKEENGYIEFLQYKGVPFQQMEKTEVPDITKTVRNYATKDREYMEKGTVGFVSWVRGYKEHYCKFIFSLDRCDLAQVANAFGLLQLPRMPELKGRKMEGFEPAAQSVIESIPYLDKAREKHRKEQQKKKKLEVAVAVQKESKQQQLKSTTPWSKQKMKLEKKHKRKMLKERKRARLAELKENEEKMEAEDEEDFKELAEEARLMKRLKQGKISRKEFEEAVGEDDFEDEMTTGGTKRKREDDGDEYEDNEYDVADDTTEPAYGDEGGLEQEERGGDANEGGEGALVEVAKVEPKPQVQNGAKKSIGTDGLNGATKKKKTKKRKKRKLTGWMNKG